MRYRAISMRYLDIIHPHVHPHVTSVGTGRTGWRRDRNWTVAQVLGAMDNGDTFYTQSESTGKITEVEAYICPICGQRWIRTCGRVAEDNKLETLPHANSHSSAPSLARG